MTNTLNTLKRALRRPLTLDMLVLLFLLAGALFTLVESLTGQTANVVFIEAEKSSELLQAWDKYTEAAHRWESLRRSTIEQKIGHVTNPDDWEFNVDFRALVPKQTRSESAVPMPASASVCYTFGVGTIKCPTTNGGLSILH